MENCNMIRAYITIPSRFGEITLIWASSQDKPRITNVLLPDDNADALARLRPAACPALDPLIADLERFLEGADVCFPLELLDLESCSPFQRQVLVAEHGVPRGWVSTYGRLARYLGQPKAARAVGRALATNPLPLLIPCHRTVRSSGHLGGYRGGLEMKRALLEMEGVRLSPQGRVLSPRFYY